MSDVVGSTRVNIEAGTLYAFNHIIQFRKLSISISYAFKFGVVANV
jgi:hypothetical protein